MKQMGSIGMLFCAKDRGLMMIECWMFFEMAKMAVMHSAIIEKMTRKVI